MTSDSSLHRAIILSAGRGGRLLPLTEHVPKCLLDIAGRSLLAWQLRALAAAGVRETVVVTGYGADLVDTEVRQHTPPGMRVRTLFNPFFQVADNLASCWMARGELSGPCLILNGDTVVTAEIVRRLLAAPPAPVTVTIDRKDVYDEDDMKVAVMGDRLTGIGKKLATDDVSGESIGFLRFDADGSARFVAEIERWMRTPAGTQLWYLSAIHELAASGAEIRILSIEGLPWGEIDYPADLVRMQAKAAHWSAQESEVASRSAADGVDSINRERLRP